MSFCLECSKVGDDLKRCSGCHIVRYCDENCQRKSWRKHRQTCKALMRRNCGCCADKTPQQDDDLDRWIQLCFVAAPSAKVLSRDTMIFVCHKRSLMAKRLREAVCYMMVRDGDQRIYIVDDINCAARLINETGVSYSGRNAETVLAERPGTCAAAQFFEDNVYNLMSYDK